MQRFNLKSGSLFYVNSAKKWLNSREILSFSDIAISVGPIFKWKHDCQNLI